MSSLEAKKITPATGTSVTLGTSGDAVSVPSDVTLKTNTMKDAGGNTIFTSNGSGTLSNVNTGLAGSMVLISSQTASSSASISFTTGLDSTYEEYVFFFVNIHPATNAEFLQFQSSIDGGSSYGVNLTSTAFSAFHAESGADGTLTYTTARDLANSTSYQYLTSGIGADENDQNACGELHLFSPSSTTYVKQWYSRSNTYEASDYTQAYYMGGFFNTASAINAIRFQMTNGNIDDGTFYLYGIT